MALESDVHKTTGTQRAVIPPEERKAVGARRVFSHKQNHDGLIPKLKAKLVAKEAK